MSKIYDFTKNLYKYNIGIFLILLLLIICIIIYLDDNSYPLLE